MAVRRGAALVPAGARRRRAADDDGHAGARRPARGARASASGWRAFGARVPARLAAWPTPRSRTASFRAPCDGGGRALPARPRAPRASSAASRSRRSAEAQRGGPRRADRPRAPRTRSCRCVATDAGRRLQLDAGLRSHRRRFGEPGGFWLPECAYEPGLERLLAEHGLELLLHRPERPRGAARRRCARSRPRPGRSRSRSTGRRSRWLWSLEGYPSDPGAHRLPPRVAARRAGLVDRRRDPRPRGRRARGRASRRGSSCAAIAARLRGAPRARPARTGLLVFAIDTELLGHWWWEGPEWLGRGGRRGRRRRGRARHAAPRRSTRIEPERAAARAARAGASTRTSRPGTRPTSPTSPGRARRLELRLLRELAGRRLARRRAPSAPRASCWPCRRATGRSSTSAARRATTRSSGSPTTPGRCSRPYTPPTAPEPAPAQPGARPEPRPAARPLEPVATRPHPLLGVPAADRGRARPPRAQALRGAGRARRRGPRAHPRRRGVARGGDASPASTSTA